MDLKEKEEKLEEIAEEVKQCKKCSLYKDTNKAVPGAGDPDADVVFIGEAPGKQEDKQGLPFVGRAGKLLDEFLEILDLNREEVFIANVIKHRPENNRDPKKQEIEACSPYLDRQLKVIDPKVIVTLGNFGLEYVLDKKGISQLHGETYQHELAGRVRKIFPMYHPAASIYNRDLRPTLEKDFRKLKKLLEKKGKSQANISDFS